MGLDMRPDRLNPVTPGIPGAIRQPQLGRESVALRSIGRRAFSRPKRRAARALSCQVLSGLLADSMTLYGEYKRFDFLPADEAPFGLQGFIDRQASEQLELMDLIVERVGLLGGVAPVPREVAGLTAIFAFSKWGPGVCRGPLAIGGGAAGHHGASPFSHCGGGAFRHRRVHCQLVKGSATSARITGLVPRGAAGGRRGAVRLVR